MTDQIMIKSDTADVQRLKGLPASFQIAGKALQSARYGSIRFSLPDGRVFNFSAPQPGPNAHVVIHDYAFARKGIAGGDVGFAEAYMDGDWSTPNLTAVLEYFSANFDAAGGGSLARGRWLVRWANVVRHLFNRNSRSGAKRNILAHYDLGNEFYGLWLDPTMTYSSALFADETASLEAAQAAKYDAIAKAVDLGPDRSVLEIGCGWGGFAEHAARHYGARVTCLTISSAQANYARKRMQAAGLSERVEILEQDYRDHGGTYDAIASIEMFEAVGETYWPDYFAKVHDCLKPAAKAALQIITIDDELFPRYRKRADFIQRYIFPGGMLPSEKALRKQVSAAGLALTEARYFGRDYARTLKNWARAFNDRWPEIERQGFDLAFKRMWNFYLSYCEAGFRNGRIDVGHFTIERA